MTTAIMIGKFMPLHKGHKYCIQYGIKNYDRMTVYIDDFNPEPFGKGYISVEDRYNIINNEFGDKINLVSSKQRNPQCPSETDDFWNIWKDLIIEANGSVPDYIIGSEAYIEKLAEVIGCQFEIIDINRDVFNISATEVRENLSENWDMLPKSTQDYFKRRIAILGPESSGKTTMTRKMSKKFHMSRVPEFAMDFLQELDRDLTIKDMDSIYKGQREYLEKYGKEPYIISDTDAITTNIWSEKLFGTFNEDAFSKNETDFNLYILMNLENYNFQDIKGRYYDDISIQKWFFNKFIEELEKRNKRYIIVEGKTWEEKEKFIEEIIAKELYIS